MSNKKYNNSKHLSNNQGYVRMLNVHHKSIEFLKRSGFTERTIQIWMILSFFADQRSKVLMRTKLCKVSDKVKLKIAKKSKNEDLQKNWNGMFEQVCFRNKEQKRKILRALKVCPRHLSRIINNFLKLGIIKKHTRFQITEYRIENPFFFENSKYTQIPIRLSGVSITNKQFPILQWIEFRLKADALSSNNTQCRLNFGQNSRTKRRKSAVLKTYLQADKNVHHRVLKTLLVRRTTDQDQFFLEFQRIKNSKGETFYLIPREKIKRYQKNYFFRGKQFRAEQFAIEDFSSQKKLGASYGLNYLIETEQRKRRIQKSAIKRELNKILGPQKNFTPKRYVQNRTYLSKTYWITGTNNSGLKQLNSYIPETHKNTMKKSVICKHLLTQKQKKTEQHNKNFYSKKQRMIEWSEAHAQTQAQTQTQIKPFANRTEQQDLDFYAKKKRLLAWSET